MSNLSSTTSFMRWEELPPELRMNVLTHMSPVEVSKLAKTSMRNREFIAATDTQRDYVNANFRYQEITIKKQPNIPLTWLYDRYPLLQAVIPYQVPDAKGSFKYWIKDNEIIIKGNIFDNYIDGDFVVSMQKGNFSLNIKGSAKFNLLTVKNYLIGNYSFNSVDNLEEIWLSVDFIDGDIDGDYAVVAFYQQLQHQQETEQEIKICHHDGANITFGGTIDEIQQAYNEFNVAGVIPDNLPVLHQVTAEDNNGVKLFRFSSNDINLNESNFTETKVTPYPQYGKNYKYKIVSNKYGDVIEINVVNNYNESVLTKTYNLPQENEFIIERESYFGYKGLLQEFGYSPQYNYPLIPEKDQMSLLIIEKDAVIFADYYLNGQIDSFYIVNDKGEKIVNLHNDYYYS